MQTESLRPLSKATLHRPGVAETLDLAFNVLASAWRLPAGAFGDLSISVPPGLKEFQTQVAYQNQDGSPLLVDFHGGFDLATGMATWAFRSVDPVSGGLPNGAFDGFLPVDDATGRGSGSIQYLVRPRAGLPTAAAISSRRSTPCLSSIT